MDGEDLVAGMPDPAGATAALATASDLLESARDCYARGDYATAFTDARDCMRMASSAILMRDGYVATTLEASVAYLESRYAGKVPVDSWERMETAFPGETIGVMNALMSALGKSRKPDRENTGEALGAAERFLASARTIIGG